MSWHKKLTAIQQQRAQQEQERIQRQARELYLAERARTQPQRDAYNAKVRARTRPTKRDRRGIPAHV